MKTIHLFAKLPDSAMHPAEFYDDTCYDTLVADEDTLVLGPFDRPLAVLLKKRTPDAMRRRVLPELRRAAQDYGELSNRGTATGVVGQPVMKLDGTVSKTSRVQVKQYPHLAGAAGGVIGYTDPTARYPFCRRTVYNREQAAAFDWISEYAELGAQLLKEYLPDCSAAQFTEIQCVNPAWAIPNTPFSTLTVNRNWRTALHKDVGDFAAGMGVMGVLGNDRYTGAYLCFPQWRVAFDIRDGDFILDDVHEFHCNTPIAPTGVSCERISCVMYLRENMAKCGTPDEEATKAKEFFERTPEASKWMSKDGVY